MITPSSGPLSSSNVETKQQQYISRANRFSIYRNQISDLKLTKDGLKKMSLIDKITLIFSNKTERKEELKKIREIIKNDIIKIKENKGKKEYITEGYVINVFKQIRHLKDEKLILSLKDAEDKKNDILDRNIENALSPELASLREQKETIKQEIDPQRREKQLEMIKLAIRIEKANLAQHLGIDFVANKGATGSLKVRNLKGKYIGIFKPIHKDTPTKVRMINWIKRTCGGQLFYLNHKTDAQSKAEVAAFKLDRHFGFNLSPPSEFREMGGKKGTFQSFFNNFNEATQYIQRGWDIDATKTNMKEKDLLNAFQKMVIFDYLIGNLDRHDENWGFDIIKKDEKIVSAQLKTIDNANAFLCKNPAAAGKVKNQYAWKNLALAQEAYTEETRDFISALTDEKMAKFIEELNKDIPGFLDTSMQEKLYDRLHVLQALEKVKYPAILGVIVSDRQIANIIKKPD